MELRVLRYFLTVAREETGARAADVLHITQPTLSRQLAQLEDELGVQLFERQGRRLLLTSDGLLLRRRAEEILDLVDKTEQELSQQEENIQGVITVGYGDIKAVDVLADCVAAFSEANPYVRFSYFSGTADVVKEAIDRGSLDIGLLLEPISVDKYDYVRLNITERDFVFMRPDDPLAGKTIIAPEDLAGKPLIVPRRHESILANWLGPYYREENIRHLITLPNVGARLTAKGHGYMIAAQECIPFCDPTKLIAKPITLDAEWQSLLAWKRGQPFSKATEKFIEHIRCFLGKV